MKSKIALLSENETKALEKLKISLMSQFPVITMYLYGSKARGDSSSGSDIDVMIELKERNFKIEREIFNIIYDIDLEFDVLIMPLFISRFQIVEGPMSESPIYKAVMQDGITL